MGVAVDGEGFGLAHVERGPEGAPKLTACRYVPCPEPDALPAALREAVANLGLSGLPCIGVLSSEVHDLLLIERPAVPDPDLRDAVRWAIRESTEFDPIEAAVGVFPFPVQGPRGREAQVFVVAADPVAVARLEDSVRSAGLDLAGIEVRELSLRNAVCARPDAAGATALLELGSKQSLLTVCRDHELFLTRGLSTSVQTLEAGLDDGAAGFDADAGPALPEALLESVLLELQRSLDYFESELSQGSVGRLLIAPSEFETSLLVPYLSRNLSARVGLLDIHELASHDGSLPQSLQARCLTAVGAALRTESAQQLDLRTTSDTVSGGVLELPGMLRVVGASLLLLLAIGGHGTWRNRALGAEVAALSAQRDARVGQLARLRAGLPAATLAQNAEARVQALEAERDARVRLLRAFPGSGGGGRLGFSSAMQGLARRSIPGLWLTGIEIADSGRELALSGRALRPELVPQLLQQLGDEPAFEGVELRTVRLGETQDGIPGVEFELTTRASDPEEAR